MSAEELITDSAVSDPTASLAVLLSESGKTTIYDLARVVTDAGYSQPKVLGYIVVDRGGVMVGNQYKHEESAQAFAAEWTQDCKAAGIDWDYRVATITEAVA